MLTPAQSGRTSPFRGLIATLAVAGILAGCSHSPQAQHTDNRACTALAKTVADREDAFVTKVRELRSKPLLLQDYDREMIAAIVDYRKALQATTLTEMSVSDEVDGCSGDRLEEMRRRVKQKMVNLRAYLNDFNRALRSDPQGVHIDQR